jgi:hypothetical protein
MQLHAPATEICVVAPSGAIPAERGAMALRIIRILHFDFSLLRLICSFIAAFCFREQSGIRGRWVTKRSRVEGFGDARGEIMKYLNFMSHNNALRNSKQKELFLVQSYEHIIDIIKL